MEIPLVRDRNRVHSLRIEGGVVLSKFMTDTHQYYLSNPVVTQLIITNTAILLSQITIVKFDWISNDQRYRVHRQVSKYFDQLQSNIG